MKRFFLACFLALCFVSVAAFGQVADVEIGSDAEVAAASAAVVDDVAEPVPVAAAEPVQVIDTAEVVTTEIDTPFWQQVENAWPVLVVTGSAVPVIVEAVKLIPGSAPWMLRLLSFILGALGGLAFGFGAFGSVSYSPGVAVLVGLMGGGGFTLVKWVSQSARGTSKGFVTMKVLLMLATIGVLSAYLVACTAAQQQVWKNAGTTLGQCLAAAGVAQADDLVTAWAGGEAIDGAAVGWSALAKALPCFAAAGAVLVTSSYDQPGDSVGAAMVPRARMLRSEKDPLHAACGDSEVPNCTVVLRR